MEISKNTKILEIATCKIWVFDNVVKVKFFAGSRVTLDDAKIITSVMHSLVPVGKRLSLLVDMKNIKSISGDARNYFIETTDPLFIDAVGLVVESTLSKLTANFFIGFNKWVGPVRLFTKENKAMDWFNGLKV